jgi:hypothetical protein
MLVSEAFEFLQVHFNSYGAEPYGDSVPEKNKGQPLMTFYLEEREISSPFRSAIRFLVIRKKYGNRFFNCCHLWE